MPNDPTNPDEFDDDGTGADTIVRLPRKDIRALEKKGKAHDELAATNQQLQRDLAFARAGIDTSTDDGAFFARGYDGDLTTEAIKARAASFGIGAGGEQGGSGNGDQDPGAGGQQQAQGGDTQQPQQQAPDTALTPEERALHQSRQQLHNGAAGDQGLETHPFEAAVELGKKVLAEGGRFDQAFGAAFNSLANAAEGGDQRVIIPSRSTQAVGAPLGT